MRIRPLSGQRQDFTSVVLMKVRLLSGAKAGFPAGWEITTDDNVVYINPRPVVQEREGDEGEN